MPDLIDDAQAREAQYLAHCLDKARLTQPDELQERDEQGRVICAECGELIPLARLKAVPGCTRCAGCQQEQEGLRRGGG